MATGWGCQVVGLRSALGRASTIACASSVIPSASVQTSALNSPEVKWSRIVPGSSGTSSRSTDSTSNRKSSCMRPAPFLAHRPAAPRLYQTHPATSDE